MNSSIREAARRPRRGSGRGRARPPYCEETTTGEDRLHIMTAATVAQIAKRASATMNPGVTAINPIRIAAQPSQFGSDLPRTIASPAATPKDEASGRSRESHIQSQDVQCLSGWRRKVPRDCRESEVEIEVDDSASREHCGAGEYHRAEGTGGQGSQGP